MGINNLSELKKKIKSYRKIPIVIRAVQIDKEVWINTREGTLKAYPGDYIIEGIQGEIYPCGEEIFNQTYEEIPI